MPVFEKMPLVCIILVNYNGYNDTCDCIESLTKIDYPNYKIIVVDNGSTVAVNDDDLEYIQNNSIYLPLTENLGFSGGNNVGIKYSLGIQGDFCLLLNNDTEVEPDFLSKLLECYFEHECEKIGIITGKICFYKNKKEIWFAGGNLDRNTGKAKHVGYGEIDNGQYDYTNEISFATGCLWLLPKNVINDIGLMSEDYFLYCEDTDYCFRLFNKAYKIYYTGSSKIYHKVSATTGADSPLQQYYNARNTLILIRKYVKHHYLVEKIYKLKLLKNVLNHKVQSKVVKKAIRDYKSNRIGRSTSYI